MGVTLKVNRHLKNKAMDHIDHALGRPVDPMGETSREYFAACKSEAKQFRASRHWKEGRSDSDLVWFYVTQKGRKALADHLREIGDKNRLFTVSWGGYDMPVVAETHSQAKFLKWLDVRDTRSDLTFGDFLSTARVRFARP